MKWTWNPFTNNFDRTGDGGSGGSTDFVSKFTSAAIDMTLIGPTLIFTPTRNFLAISTLVLCISTTGFVDQGTISIGNNAPDYNNIMSETIPNIFIAGNYAIIPQDQNTLAGDGLGIFAQVVQPSNSTTLIVTATLTGVYVS